MLINANAEPFHSLYGGHPTSLDLAIKTFNKKFKNFCNKSPLRLSYLLLPSGLQLVINKPTGDIVLSRGWDILEETIEKGIEEHILKKGFIYNFNTPEGKELRQYLIDLAVKQFIYDIRLSLAEYLPVLRYRKFQTRELTEEEMAERLVTLSLKKQDLSSAGVTKTTLETSKIFIMEQIFLAKDPSNPKSLFSLSDSTGVRHLYKFKTGLVMPFLYKMWNTPLSPDELGKEFFTQAKLVSSKGAEVVYGK